MKNLSRDVVQKCQTQRAKPRTSEDDAIECLAAEIDWLENYLDKYGSVVAKQPDIWGESRLTKFRHQVEEQLAARIGGFTLRDNASIIKSDIANLASAISIGALADSSLESFQQDRDRFRGGQERALAVYEAQLAVYQNQLAAYEQFLNANGQQTAPVAPTAPDVGTAPVAPSLPSFTLPNGLTPGEIGSVSKLGFKGLTAGSNLEPVIELNQLKRYLDHLNQLRRVNEGDDTSDAPGYALNLVRMPVSILPGRATRRGYGAEVTVTARPIKSRALLPNTFRNLSVNDLIDQLSLPVLRLAESGKLQLAIFLDDRREESQILKYEILNFPPEAAQDACVFKLSLMGAICRFASANSMQCSACAFKTQLGLVLEYSQQLEAALVAVGDSKTAKSVVEVRATLKEMFATEINDESLDPGWEYLAQSLVLTPAEKNVLLLGQQKTLNKKRQSLNSKAVAKTKESISSETVLPSDFLRVLESVSDDELRSFHASPNLRQGAINKLVTNEGGTDQYKKEIEKVLNSLATNLVDADREYDQYQTGEEFVKDYSRDKVQQQIEGLQKIGTTLQESLQSIVGNLDGEFASTTATSRSRRSRFPISPAVSKATYGDAQLRRMALHLKNSYKGRHIVWNDAKAYEHQIHLVDAQNFLQECFDSAYDTLSEPALRPTLIETVEGANGFKSLAELVTLGDVIQIEALRQNFLESLSTFQVEQRIGDCCWCIVVEMAMLNKRLNEDAHEHAIKKGDCSCRTGCYHQYYLPMPKCSLEDLESRDPDFTAAADEFCNYVACRWPIHVFTIDPINQEQNVSDASIVRRELSIAAALAFSSGQISLNQLTRFQRQFQEDIATVGLNRTQVGFMHGFDTFGWRFTPRIQTRSPQGNIRAFGETLLGRRADANWRESTLEPGIRECTAIVLMPSFVPYCDFDIRTNWFQITRPTHSDVSMKETMKLSRSVTQMRQAQHCCMQCAHLYRPGEVDRLLNRVEQLEREIPLQTLRAQIPYENTLGGFDLFNNGLTDLGPRLDGWYGAPGIVIGFNETDEDKKKRRAKRPTETSLFLVADNLSVNQTQIIAGGIPAKDPILISRQVVRITVPDDAQLVEIDGRQFVAVYIATPYGVTNHLHIPVVTAGLESDSAKSIADLQSALLAKLAETPYQWTDKSTIEIEINFVNQNQLCNVGGATLVRKNDIIKLASRTIDTRLNTIDLQRPFSIVGVIKSSDGKTTFGQPIELVAGQRLDLKRQKSWRSSELITDDVLRTLQSEITSALFKGENSLKLKIETYILFKNTDLHRHGDANEAEFNESFDIPVRIGGELDVVITANQRCETVIISPLPISGGPVSTEFNPDAPAFQPNTELFYETDSDNADEALDGGFDTNSYQPGGDFRGN